LEPVNIGILSKEDLPEDEEEDPLLPDMMMNKMY
jgi:hypothetical protein